jgi:hypothetical protein
MIEVTACRIDKSHIYYICPFCSTLRNGRIVDNNKKKYISMKPTFHRHGSGGSTENRTEYRGSHCTINNTDIKIRIDETTIRE